MKLRLGWDGRDRLEPLVAANACQAKFKLFLAQVFFTSWGCGESSCWISFWNETEEQHSLEWAKKFPNKSKIWEENSEKIWQEVIQNLLSEMKQSDMSEATHTMQSDAVVQVKLSDNRKMKKSCFCCCINELQIEELRIVRK